MKYYLIEGINPEPWTAPELGTGRRGNKIFPTAHTAPQQRAYQEAIKEEALRLQEADPFDEPSPYSLQIWFWRNQAEGDYGTGRKRQANIADATNLQKSFEDALQGIFFTNDRHNVDVRSRLVAQGPEVTPLIFFTLTHCIEEEFEGWVQRAIDAIQAEREANREAPVSNIVDRGPIPF